MNPSATASMHELKKTFPSIGCLAFTAAILCLGGTVPAADQTPDSAGIRGLADRDWILPEARQVELAGAIGEAYRFLTVASVDANEDQIAQAAKAGSQLALAPWEKVRQDAATAFVFDLIAVPTTSGSW